MHKLLILLCFAFPATVWGQQFSITQTLGSSKTIVSSKGALKSDSGYINAVYPDTASASRGLIASYPGSQIVAGNKVFIRSADASRWVGTSSVEIEDSIAYWMQGKVDSIGVHAGDILDTLIEYHSGTGIIRGYLNRGPAILPGDNIRFDTVPDGRISIGAVIPESGQENVQSDWLEGDSTKDSYIRNKPTQTSFSIFQQNPDNAVVINTNATVSIINPSSGTATVLNNGPATSFIGKFYGVFSCDTANVTLTVAFKSGGTYVVEVPPTSSSGQNMPFMIDFKMDFTNEGKARYTGIIIFADKTVPFSTVPNASGYSPAFDCTAKISGGKLTIQSGYLHRNNN